MQDKQPSLEVRVDGVVEGEDPWRIAFELTNTGDAQLHLIEAWLPHEVLHADEVDLSHLDPVAPGGDVTLNFTATFAMREEGEPSNPFLIVRLAEAGVEWRVLARLAVQPGARGEPLIDVASVTMHRVGFSAASS